MYMRYYLLYMIKCARSLYFTRFVRNWKDTLRVLGQFFLIKLRGAVDFLILVNLRQS